MILSKSCMGYTPRWNDKEYCYPVVFPWEVMLQGYFGLEHFQDQNFFVKIEMLDKYGTLIADISSSFEALIGKDMNGRNLFNVQLKSFPPNMPTRFKLHVTILSDGVSVYDRYTEDYSFINDACLSGFKLPTPYWMSVANGGALFANGIAYSVQVDGSGLPDGIRLVSNTDRNETYLIFDGGRYVDMYGKDNAGNIIDFENEGMICESEPCQVDSLLLEGLFDCFVPDGHYTGDVINDNGKLLNYRFLSRVYGDLILQPAAIKRTIAINNKNQRSERTRQWLLQGYVPLPEWQKEEIETLFMAERILIHGQEYVFKEGSIFERQKVIGTSGYWLKVMLEDVPEIKDYTCDDRCNTCSKPTDLRYVLSQSSCPEGYMLSEDGSYCYKVEKVAATPPSGGGGTPGIAYRRTNGAYGNYGALIYQEGGYNVDGGAKSGMPATAVSTVPLWANPNTNNNDGRLNNVGIWGVDDCDNHNYQPIANEFIGFSRKVEIPATKQYYIGIAGDNQAQIKINGVAIVTQNYPPPDADNFKYWHIYPVMLQAGLNYVELLGKDDGSVSASFGAEIYDNTEAELIAAQEENDLNLVFTTKSIFCQPFDVGETVGYTCPVGYSVDNSTTPPMCVKISRTAPENAPKVIWNTVGRAVRYEVQWRQIGSSEWSDPIYTNDHEAALNLAQNASFQVRVRALCPDRNSEWSYLGVNTFTTSTDCLQPSGIIVTDDGNGKVYINWEDVPGAIGYNFRYRIQGTGVWKTERVSLSEITISGLVIGSLYEYQIQTKCSTDQTSNWGVVDSFTVSTNSEHKNTCPIAVEEEFTGRLSGIKDANLIVTLSGSIEYIGTSLPEEGDLIQLATLGNCCYPYRSFTMSFENDDLVGELTLDLAGQILLSIDSYKGAPAVNVDLTGIQYQSVDGDCPYVENPGGGGSSPEKLTADISYVCPDQNCSRDAFPHIVFNFPSPTTEEITILMGLIARPAANVHGVGAIGYDLFEIPSGVEKWEAYNRTGKGNVPFKIVIPAGIQTFTMDHLLTRDIGGSSYDNPPLVCHSCHEPVTDIYLKIESANKIPDFAITNTNINIHNVS